MPLNSRKKAKFVYVGFKFPQMGPHSGYDKISEYMPYDIRIDLQPSYIRLKKFIDQRTMLSRIYFRLFGFKPWWIEFQCVLIALLNPNCVFHFVYPEQTLGLLNRIKIRGHKVVATIHQPAELISKIHTKLSWYRGIDLILLVSPTDLDFFATNKGDSRVAFIPHGIDAEYFQPSDDPRNMNEVIMVGNMLRDFPFAAEVFLEAKNRNPNFQVHVVCSTRNAEYFANMSHVHCHFEISDESLRALYQSAKILFLPLQDFTANNAVLEAAACGCPILVASPTQKSGYFNSLIKFTNVDVDSSCSELLHLMEDTGEYGAMLRRYVLDHYSWQAVANQTMQIMRDHNILGENSNSVPI